MLPVVLCTVAFFTERTCIVQPPHNSKDESTFQHKVHFILKKNKEIQRLLLEQYQNDITNYCTIYHFKLSEKTSTFYVSVQKHTVKMNNLDSFFSLWNAYFSNFRLKHQVCTTQSTYPPSNSHGYKSCGGKGVMIPNQKNLHVLLAGPTKCLLRPLKCKDSWGWI